ncbi:DUF397 domain-containing protein [Parasphingorhabdus pacifica]
MPEWSRTHWRKSTRSGSTSNCVEVGFNAATVGVRDTKDRAGGIITLSEAQWAGFLSAIKRDRYQQR